MPPLYGHGVGQRGAPYHNYVLKPSKLRGIHKPILQGVNGEKMVLNNHHIYKPSMNSGGVENT